MTSENGTERTVILDRHEVTRLLPMDECVEVMAAALATVARGNAILPLRPMIRLPDSPNIFALMPAYLGEPKSVGVKVLTVFPVNHGTPMDAHQGAVLLFEADHGRLLAILDATTVTAIRTAAVSAVATRLLAREDAEDLAILGAGTQGRMHLEAMTGVRQLRCVRIWSRTTEHARALAQLARERFELHAEVSSTPAHAVERASIVCTTTASPTPVLEGEWLQPGTHVNAVGACVPTTRELDTDAVRRARLYVDRRDSALAEPGDILFPLREGAISTDHIVAEIGELLLEGGERLRRRDESEITLFKSLGLAVEDLAAAHHVYRKASASGAGTWIALGGTHDEVHAELHA
jgi:ornithine cyclodeaminase/alanine dehydrogenase-like protein (mu-crystallin family)